MLVSDVNIENARILFGAILCLAFKCQAEILIF